MSRYYSDVYYVTIKIFRLRGPTLNGRYKRRFTIHKVVRCEQFSDIWDKLHDYMSEFHSGEPFYVDNIFSERNRIYSSKITRQQEDDWLDRNMPLPV